jgi:MinD-like ATPase involved in chromosome partitioning or flagellar assembly
MTRKTGSDRHNHVNETSADYSSAPPKRMFTPASFAEMLNPEDFSQSIKVGPSNLPPVVSFYGLKGGAGRSLCLAYSAVLLARRGLKVGVIDFDFEAPGLHAIFDIENSSVGSLAILEEGNYRNRKLDIWSSIETIPIESKGKVMVMTAGRINAQYLLRLDNLRPMLWNEYDSQPVSRLLSGFTRDEFDVVLIDCRTGFHGITASVLFHYSDLVVALFPLSEQIWDGAYILSEAWKNTRQIREDEPEWIIVPSMVPSGKEGKTLLNRFAIRLGKLFSPEDEYDETADLEDLGLVPDGIPYHPSIAAEGTVPRKFSPAGAWRIFEPLVERIAVSLAVDSSVHIVGSVDFGKILAETDIPAADGFAEALKPDDISYLLVPSEDLQEALEPSMGIIVGAKGSGKTLAWRCCVELERSHEWVRKNEGYAYLVGHPPKPELDPSAISITRAQFEQLERDGQMKHNMSSYEQFWIFYALYRLCRRFDDLPDALSKLLPLKLRGKFKRAMSAEKPDLKVIIKERDILDCAEDLLLVTDQFLRDRGPENEKYIFCYDGLDTDFQSVGDDWVERRNRFIKGLLLLVSEYRGRLHRILFKVFLREDIYISIEGLQNKSHMEAYKKELKFQSRDLWRLAMNLVYKESDTFKNYIFSAAPGLNPPWDVEEKKLMDLLDVIWGNSLGKGNKSISTNYIIKRIRDAQGRLFPRTFVQMMRQAFLHAKASLPASDRVLPHQSLTRGVEEASAQRTQDLTAEYVELKDYFDALHGMRANFDRDTFEEHLTAHLKKSGKKTTKEVNWILDRLETVGVISKKESADGTLFSVALMYRSGLGVKGAGLK